MKPNLIVVLGPTASGKTKLATQLAYSLDSEIIIADSRQVYKELTIGSGKDYAEYTIANKKIPARLIDIVSINQTYNVYQYKKDFEVEFEKFTTKIPILCGGTGLYINALLRDFEFTQIPLNQNFRDDFSQKTHSELIEIYNSLPKTAYSTIADISTQKRTVRAIEICTFLQENTIEKKNKKPVYPFVIGIDLGVEARRKNIKNRLQERIQMGLIDEVENLLTLGVLPKRLIFLGLEYKFVTEYLQGKTSLDEMTNLLTIAIQQFAKRQMTYFRKMERDGLNIFWVNDINTELIAALKSKIEHATFQ